MFCPAVPERLLLVIDECGPDIIGYVFFCSLGFDGALCGVLPMPEGLYAGEYYRRCERVACKGGLVSMWGKCNKRPTADVDTGYSGFRGPTCAEDLLHSTPIVRVARSFSILRKLCATAVPTRRAVRRIMRAGTWMT